MSTHASYLCVSLIPNRWNYSKVRCSESLQKHLQPFTHPPNQYTLFVARKRLIGLHPLCFAYYISNVASFQHPPPLPTQPPHQVCCINICVVSDFSDKQRSAYGNFSLIPLVSLRARQWGCSKEDRWRSLYGWDFVQ